MSGGTQAPSIACISYNATASVDIPITACPHTIVYLTASASWQIDLPDAYYAGQKVTIIVNSANLPYMLASRLRTGMHIHLITGDVLEFTSYGGGDYWYQSGGSVGMGRFVPVVEPDGIADWIAVTVTSWADVDVSDDSCRKGACAVQLSTTVAGNTAIAQLQLRGNGRTAGLYGHEVGTGAGNVEQSGPVTVSLDNEGIFEAQFSASKGGTTTARVTGYYI